MKFKMKAILLMGCCLLLTDSQLKAAEKLTQGGKEPIIEFPCTSAMKKEGAYHFDASLTGGTKMIINHVCDSSKKRPFKKSVAPGDYNLGGFIVPIGKKGMICDGNKVSFAEGKTYEISFMIDSSSKKCTVSSQEK